MAWIKKEKYKNKKGVWKEKYYIYFYDIKGKPTSAGISYSTRSEAKKHLGEYDNNKTSEYDATLKDLVNLYEKKTEKSPRQKSENCRGDYFRIRTFE